MDAGAIGFVIFRFKRLIQHTPPSEAVSSALCGKSIDALRHTKQSTGGSLPLGAGREETRDEGLSMGVQWGENKQTTTGKPIT
jgi:hypothetical protein